MVSNDVMGCHGSIPGVKSKRPFSEELFCMSFTLGANDKELSSATDSVAGASSLRVMISKTLLYLARKCAPGSNRNRNYTTFKATVIMHDTNIII